MQEVSLCGTHEGVSADRAGVATLRADQIAQTRTALVQAARRLFGDQGFAATSVGQVAREARVTTGALYHHFRTKTELFEAVFVWTHAELMAETGEAGVSPTDEIEFLASGFEAFLNAVQRPDVRQIIVVDGPAVLGLARFTELDERDAAVVIAGLLREATASGRLSVADPDTVARLLLGALTRGALLIASAEDSATARTAVATSMRAFLNGLAPDRSAITASSRAVSARRAKQ
jgi:AcrR family transcriptional regulator